MARQAREASGTGIYHVMLRGINRQNIFEDEEDYRRFLMILFQMVCPVDEKGYPLPSRCIFYAYCLMPNHVHLLVREASDNLADVVKRIGGSYAQYFNKNTSISVTFFRIVSRASQSTTMPISSRF
jgi:REP element-mobilizing transposase RayT